MSAEKKLMPTASQTVGPFFTLGLQYMVPGGAAAAKGARGGITLYGKVLDRDGAPVPDALIEFWSATEGSKERNAMSGGQGIPDGFRRAATNADGEYSVRLGRPGGGNLDDERKAAPHLLVLVFMRGLLRHLISRVYFAGEEQNESDAVLQRIPAERRATLEAKREDGGQFRWDIRLQGPGETVFFAW